MSARWTPLALAAVSALACQANEDAFYDSVSLCSSSGPTDQCGTTRSGKPMICYAGSQLGGGADFCTEQCDPSAAAVDPGHVCLSSGALLRRCTPDPPEGTPSTGCPRELNCYRTDIASNEGVCLWMHVCKSDGDCMDPTRPKCVATIIHEIEPLITTDNLECVQPTCASSGSSCKTGESCSANFYNTGGAVPDICLPDCLGNDECPPNYACAYNAGASGAAHVCIPGIPGERCNHEEDCIWGDCLETGAGFSECIVGSSCKNDNNLDNDLNCAILNGPDENFACAANGRCVGLTAFNGTACTMDRDCPSPQSCFFYSPYTGRGAKGECRVPCPDLTCSPRGGVPEVCLDSGAGGCYPGNFALPCTTSSECLSEFTCMAVSPDPRTIIDSPTICTISCATDDDCQNEPFIRNSGFCLDGVCRFSGRSGSPCSRDTECQGGMCANGICS